MNKNQIREIVSNALNEIAPEADLDELNPGENIREALDIDSFDYLNFLIHLHDKLGVEIPESDYDQLTTLDDIVSYVYVRIN